MTYPMAKIIIDENSNLVGKEISHDPDNIVIEALFAAEKNSSSKDAKKIYDEILKGMDNKPALIKSGILQKPLDVYVAGVQHHKVTFIPLSLVLSHVLPG
jgi:hypothetical protein